MRKESPAVWAVAGRMIPLLEPARSAKDPVAPGARFTGAVNGLLPVCAVEIPANVVNCQFSRMLPLFWEMVAPMFVMVRLPVMGPGFLVTSSKSTYEVKVPWAGLNCGQVIADKPLGTPAVSAATGDAVQTTTISAPKTWGANKRDNRSRRAGGSGKSSRFQSYLTKYMVLLRTAESKTESAYQRNGCYPERFGRYLNTPTEADTNGTPHCDHAWLIPTLITDSKSSPVRAPRKTPLTAVQELFPPLSSASTSPASANAGTDQWFRFQSASQPRRRSISPLDNSIQTTDE